MGRCAKECQHLSLVAGLKNSCTSECWPAVRVGSEVPRLRGVNRDLARFRVQAYCRWVNGETCGRDIENVDGCRLNHSILGEPASGSNPRIRVERLAFVEEAFPRAEIETAQIGLGAGDNRVKHRNVEPFPTLPG